MPQLVVKAKAEATKKGRPKLWVPALVTDEEKARGLQLLTDYGTPDDAEVRVVRDFHLFLTINELQPTGYAMLLWCGQCLVAGLGPGSLETYGTFVRKVLPRGDPMIRKLTKALMRQHADFDTKSAPVVSDEDLIKIMLLLPEELGAGVFLMLVAGLRPIALKWLRRKQIISRNRTRDPTTLVYIQVRVDKNTTNTLRMLGPRSQRRNLRPHLRRHLLRQPSYGDTYSGSYGGTFDLTYGGSYGHTYGSPPPATHTAAPTAAPTTPPTKKNERK